MTLVLVAHETDVPALYGAAAAAVAVRRQARMMHLPARFDTQRHADAVQHVLACGALGPSGLIWYERLSGRPAEAVSTIAEIVAASLESEIVVSMHQAFLKYPQAREELLRAAAAAGAKIEAIEIDFDGTVFRNRADVSAEHAFRDEFGRIALERRAATKPDGRLKIGLIGAESDHRDVYPAALASLADAADALAIALDIRFIDPKTLSEATVDRALEGLDGILLPGGSEMANVPGQIEAASAGLATGLPTVGLCLGMQTMATALAWRAFGRGKANLAEADPSAEIKTFIAMAGHRDEKGAPLPEHRMGEQVTRVLPKSRLAAALPSTLPVRYNHRFRLAPELLPPLHRAGLQVVAEGLNGAIADAIEDVDHPFYIGMQGHPELASSDVRPHPLLMAFLAAAKSRSSQS